MMSQEPDKRVVAALETAEWLPLFCSIYDRFMPLPFPTREEQLNDSEIGFCSPQPYHIIPPSRNRYRKRYEVQAIQKSCT